MSGKQLKTTVRLACIQLASGSDKAANLALARERIFKAASKGANIIVLPECFNSPYGIESFADNAEVLPSAPANSSGRPSLAPFSQSYEVLSLAAQEADVYLVGGSIIELDPSTGKMYNTCLVFSRRGDLLAKHRKVHLFDVDIPGGITFTESKIFSPGDQLTLVDLPEYGKLGIAVCYDIRFPEMSMVAARSDGGCFAFVVPAAFNLSTGPLHWELQARARAMDNQNYVALCSPARSPDGSQYQAWGHSMIVDPHGRVITEAGVGDEIIYADMAPETIEEIRRAIPLNSQRRLDVYQDVTARYKQA